MIYFVILTRDTATFLEMAVEFQLVVTESGKMKKKKEEGPKWILKKRYKRLLKTDSNNIVRNIVKTKMDAKTLKRY